jgi:hypothetical protein
MKFFELSLSLIVQASRTHLVLFALVQVPEGLEAGISTMSRKEKSIIYVTRNHLTKASLIKELPDDVEELMFEVEMIQIIQVIRYHFVSLSCCIICRIIRFELDFRAGEGFGW